jgi:hypothetical protein
MRVLSFILILVFITSCGSKDAALLEITPTENIEVKDPEEGAEEVVALLPVEKACDLFSSEHNEFSEDFKNAFQNLDNKCQSETPLKEKHERAVMESFAMASEFFGNFDRDAHKKCVPQAKKLLKTVYSQFLRNQAPETDKRAIQKSIAKVRMDNLFRSLIRNNCINNFDSFSYTYKGEEKEFSFNENHLLNGSFELFKIEKDFVTLNRQWTLVAKNKIPGWSVKAVNPQEGKNCSLLEFQGDGVVTTVPNGSHIVELDSHCKNLQTNNVSGDARVEINQSVPVKEVGSYRLTMKAQKRGGSHGDLQVTVFQRGRDKEFESISLPNQSVWSDVCVDVEIVENERNVRIAIRDGDSEGRQTYGLLLDNVSFEKGSCP